jgi:phage gp29-like protein
MPETKPPPLVWPNGQRMERAQLTQRVAGPSIQGVRSIITGHPAQNLSPGKLANILRQAEQGDAISYLELAEEMEEKDLHYLAVLKKRKEAISQLPIEVIAAGDDAQSKADSELVEEWIERDELQDEMIDMLDAIGKGWSVTEIVWETSASLWLPACLERCDQRFFQFDLVDGKTLRLRGDGGQLEDLAAAKYIIHRAPSKSGLPVRGGIARAAAWHYLFKNIAWKDWVSFLEKFGMPLRLGRYDNGETEENKQIMLNALASLGSDAAAMFPKTMEVEFVDGKQGAAPNDLWKALIDTCDEYLSKVVLGQTNTTDAKSGGLGSGQANVHREVEESIERSDARRLSATLNRDLVVPMVMLNRGPRTKYPKIRIGRPDPVDVEAMGKAASIFVPMGMKVSMAKMREASGLPAPETDDEEILQMPGGAAPVDATVDPSADPNADPNSDPSADPGKKTRQTPVRGRKGADDPEEATPAFLAPLRGHIRPIEAQGAAADAAVGATGSGEGDVAPPDFIDLTTEEALSDWEELIGPLVSGIEAQLASATTIEEARALLLDGIDDLDARALTEILARGGFAAHLQGRLDVQEGT